MSHSLPETNRIEFSGSSHIILRYSTNGSLQPKHQHCRRVWSCTKHCYLLGLRLYS